MDHSLNPTGNFVTISKEEYSKLLGSKPETKGRTPLHLASQANIASASFTSSSQFEGMSSNPKNIWILDTGAKHHIVCNKDLLSYAKTMVGIYVESPDGHQANIAHIGAITLTNDLFFNDVLYVPMFQFNLVSIS